MKEEKEQEEEEEPQMLTQVIKKKRAEPTTRTWEDENGYLCCEFEGHEMVEVQVPAKKKIIQTQQP